MKYNATNRKLSEIKTDCLCLPSTLKTGLSERGKELDQALDGIISAAIKQNAFKHELGKTLTLDLVGNNAKRIVIFGLGAQKSLTSNSFDTIAKATVKAISGKNATIELEGVCTIQEDSLAPSCESFIRELFSDNYLFEKYKSKKSEKIHVSQVSFAADKPAQNIIKKAISYGQALTEGMSLTRDLGNEPGNVCTPSYLAETAKGLAKEYSELTCKVLEEKDMEKLNMGAFLSVSKGSTEPGKLIVLEYKGGKTGEAPHVLVGKGVTFDTGGISLKPGAQMDEMKYDMCGAASVLGAMKAVAELKPKKNIIGVIAAAENMPAGNASKPGDIVTTASGLTVEILNTDAEGRLVLCDALTYVEKFKPKSVIDIATLTGACIIALGHATSAVMSNSDEFAKTLMDCGQEANDQAWQLPIWDIYQTQIDSPFADIQNIGGKGAGSITAACFLSRFTKSYTWAHLDIAGTAWNSGANKGATGRPVPLLLNYLINHA
jgi:leucyl aminopeptidase